MPENVVQPQRRRRARHPDYIKARGGFVTSENPALANDIVRRGGFNAGTGTSRTELYNELQAMLDGDAEHIRRGMDRRRRLIELGMFPVSAVRRPYVRAVQRP